MRLYHGGLRISGFSRTGRNGDSDTRSGGLVYRDFRVSVFALLDLTTCHK